MTLNSEIAIALISALTAIAVALISNKKRKKVESDLSESEKNLRVAEKEIKMQSAVLDFAGFIQEFGVVYQEVKHLMETTCIDRFIIFRAWNGVTSPRWTTAVIQIREGLQEPITYQHYELDDDYRMRLSMMNGNRSHYVDVADLSDCGIKRVYEAEGVQHSVWVDIFKQKFDDGTAAHTYASFASHSDEGIDQTLITRCEILAGQLKGVALSFKDAH